MQCIASLISGRRPGPALVLLACALLQGWSGNAGAQTIACTASMTDLNFGTYAPLAGTAATINGTLSYSCTNNAILDAHNVAVCFSIGSGGGGAAGSLDPRYLLNSAYSSPSNSLSFSIHQPGNSGALWGSVFSASSPAYTRNLQINPRSTASASVSFSATVAASQTQAASGSYTSKFNGNHTALHWAWAPWPALPLDCQTGTLLGGSHSTNANAFAFTANATVSPYCTVRQAQALDFGSVDSLNTATAAQNTLSVQCTSQTAYRIGLLPSSSNTGGAGLMSATGAIAGNTDKVPYTLYQNAARSTAWGNLVANSVSGTGDGSSHDLTVYGSVPSTNVTPDSYKDIVTVTVTY